MQHRLARPTMLTAAALGAAVAAPVALTLLLVGVNFDNPRDYVFLYLGIVAVLGVASGIGPALVAGALSAFLVDFNFVPPRHTLSIGNGEDIVNLVVFLAAAALVGGLGSRRRSAQLRSQALAADLQQANLDLARLNREQALAAALAAQLAERDRQVAVLEETDRLRHEFFANVSHELRTPLGGILTGTTALLSRESLDTSVRTELAEVADASRRLARLVSDMLDMARIEGGALELRLDSVDVRDALQAAATRLRRHHPERAVKIDVATAMPEVRADWDRLGQVLDNLLSNADTFAPAGADIVLRAEAAPESVIIRVIDGGPGVAAELRDTVFDRFVRGSAGGTGLGLPIVRGLVEAQGGRVWLEAANPGEGGHFAFSLAAA